MSHVESRVNVNTTYYVYFQVTIVPKTKETTLQRKMHKIINDLLLHLKNSLIVTKIV